VAERGRPGQSRPRNQRREHENTNCILMVRCAPLPSESRPFTTAGKGDQADDGGRRAKTHENGLPGVGHRPSGTRNAIIGRDRRIRLSVGRSRADPWSHADDESAGGALCAAWLPANLKGMARNERDLVIRGRHESRRGYRPQFYVLNGARTEQEPETAPRADDETYSVNQARPTSEPVVTVACQ